MSRRRLGSNKALCNFVDMRPENVAVYWERCPGLGPESTTRADHVETIAVEVCGQGSPSPHPCGPEPPLDVDQQSLLGQHLLKNDSPPGVFDLLEVVPAGKQGALRSYRDASSSDPEIARRQPAHLKQVRRFPDGAPKVERVEILGRRLVRHGPKDMAPASSHLLHRPRRSRHRGGGRARWVDISAEADRIWAGALAAATTLRNRR